MQQWHNEKKNQKKNTKTCGTHKIRGTPYIDNLVSTTKEHFPHNVIDYGRIFPYLIKQSYYIYVVESMKYYFDL